MNESPKITRRGIQISLGVLWLLDGMLQLQPQMFTPDFISNVIEPASQGQPGFVTGPMHFFAHIFLMQPIVFNTIAAVIQLLLGLLILWKRTSRLGLWCSVGWGIFVWYVGEGLNGLASGHTSLLMGAPGAALIYVLLALGVLSRKPDPNHSEYDHRPSYWLLIAWITLWTIGTVYQLLPGQNTVTDMSAMISMNASSAPSWMASIDKGVATMLNEFGTATESMSGMSMTSQQMTAMPTHQVSGLWFLLLLALLQLFIGFAVIVPGFMRWLAITLGCILALIFWVIGQSMGSYFTGLATDPGSGPLFVLLGIAVLGCTQYDEQVKHFFWKIKDRIKAEARAFNEADV